MLPASDLCVGTSGKGPLVSRLMTGAMTPAARSLLSRILALLPSPHLKVALPGLTKALR